MKYILAGLVQYLIVSEESDLPFNLDTHTGSISLSSQLDFETKTNYQFTVRAFNKVTPNFYQETAVQIRLVFTLYVCWVLKTITIFIRTIFHADFENTTF